MRGEGAAAPGGSADAGPRLWGDRRSDEEGSDDELPDDGHDDLRADLIGLFLAKARGASVQEKAEFCNRLVHLDRHELEEVGRLLASSA